MGHGHSNRYLYWINRIVNLYCDYCPNKGQNVYYLFLKDVLLPVDVLILLYHR